MFGDILYNQLLVSHTDATFSVRDHRDGYGRYTVLVRGSMKHNVHAFSLQCFVIIPNYPKQTERERLLILLLGTIRQLYPKNDYHRQKMS